MTNNNINKMGSYNDNVVFSVIYMYTVQYVLIGRNGFVEVSLARLQGKLVLLA